MPLILGTNSIKDTGYDVANSVRFNDNDSAYMHKTPGSAGDQQKFTFSFWIKRSNIETGTTMTLFDTQADGDNQFKIRLNDNSTLTVESKVSDHNDSLITNQLFRDVSAWYSIIIAVDTTQGTAGNRVKLYVNGTRVTSFATENYPAENLNTLVNAANKLYVGTSVGTDSFYDGYLAEFCLVDGSQLAETSFGEFDSDSPTIWKPIDVSGLTFGTNGFYLDFEDSGNLGNDANGGTDLTEVNLAATDQSIDTCTNNFCTLNLLAKGANVTLSDGNLQFTSNNRYGTVGTFGLSSGKWYWEVKVVDAGSDIQVGIFQDGGNIGHPNAELGKTSQGWSVISIGGNRLHDLSQSSYGGAAFADDDVLMVALDMDNGKWYMGKNNSWFDSGNPATSSSPAHTGITGTIFPAIATYVESESGSINYQFNFGSPPYAISSGNADGEGFGNFEYAVPSGYFAINTKNLAEYGG